MSARYSQPITCRSGVVPRFARRPWERTDGETENSCWAGVLRTTRINVLVTLVAAQAAVIKIMITFNIQELFVIKTYSLMDSWMDGKCLCFIRYK